MIEKLKYNERQIGGEDMVLRTEQIPAQPWEIQDKINELIDAVNALIEENNIHEKQIDELQMKLEPEKCETGTTADKLLDPTPSLLEEYLEKAKSEEEKKAIKILAPDLLACEQELDRTKKALDVAVDALKEYSNEEHWDFEHFYSLYTYDKAKEALEQINKIKGGK